VGADGCGIALNYAFVGVGFAMSAVFLFRNL
jgi:hypothetical protein